MLTIVGILALVVVAAVGLWTSSVRERDSDARLHAVFENHHTVMLLVDSASGSIVDANPAAESFYGCSRAQLSTQRIFDLDSATAAQLQGEMDSAVKDAGEGLRSRHRRADGEIREVEIFWNPVFSKRKRLLYAVIRDAAGRVDTTSTAAKNRTLLHIASTLARFGGWSIDLAEGTLLWSDEVAAIHDMPAGYSPPLAEGINFYAPEWRAKITAAFQACTRDGTPYDEEMEIITATGRRVWVRALGAAIRDEAGKVFRVHGAFQDITERKRVEQQLVESERQYRALFENMTAGFVLFEVVEDERQRPADLLVLACNRGFEKTTGLPAQEVVGKALTQALPGIEHDAANWIGTYGKVALSGEPSQFEQYSELLGVHYLVSAFQAGAKRCAVTFIDVTERRRAEADVRRLHEELQRHAALLEHRVAERTAELEAAKVHAEAADRAKSGFLATMSHELRTPLNAIIGFTDVLLAEIPGPLTVEQEKQLGIVQQSSHHLLGLISDVLDIARVEAGQIRLAREPFDLRGMVEHVGQVLGPEASRRGLGFTVNAGTEAASVIGDRRRVEQVLNNLLSNALKFTTRGTIEVELERGVDEFTITVVDTGVGIRQHELDMLFRPFSQTYTGLPTLREGTGLGLAISKHLVAAMGGRIGVESEWGTGSRFHFTIPARPAG